MNKWQENSEKTTVTTIFLNECSFFILGQFNQYGLITYVSRYVYNLEFFVQSEKCKAQKSKVFSCTL